MKLLLNKHLTSISGRTKTISAFLIAVTIVVAIVLYILISNRNPPIEDYENEFVQQEIITYSVDTPDEEEILEDSYSVSPSDPRSINLPTINTKGFIQKVGVDQNNQIAVPNNVNLAGWYINSVKPGEKGLSIIDGHVDGPTTNGIFFNLENLTKGDEFSVEYGDSSNVKFSVVEIVETETAKAAEILFNKHKDIYSQLNLITCIGTYINEVNSYDKRLIVIAQKVE